MAGSTSSPRTRNRAFELRSSQRDAPLLGRVAVVVEPPVEREAVSLPYRGLVRENAEITYRGVILEIVAFSSEVYADAATVLSNATLAFDLKAGRLLADPGGRLRQLHEEVAAEFGRRKWVRARCDEQRMLALGTAEKALAA